MVAVVVLLMVVMTMVVVIVVVDADDVGGNDGVVDQGYSGDRVADNSDILMVTAAVVMAELVMITVMVMCGNHESDR